MTAAHRDVAPLLGAWAVGACSPEEDALVRRHLAECSECARESRLLTGSPAPASPGRGPGDLRERILGAALGRRAPAPPVPGFAAPYAAQTSVLDVLLAELTDRDWATNVIYDWNVQDVVAHLSATDRLLTDQLARHPEERPGVGDLVDASTAAAIERERGRRPEETRATWKRQTRALCAGLNGAEAADKVWIRQGMRLDNAVVARAFETWVHTVDIAGAVGRSLPDPLPEHLHAIAGLGVRALPAAFSSRGLRSKGLARIVLDGPGGGDWLVTLGGDGASAPVVTLRMDALEFCMLAADRRDPSTIDVSITGDRDVGRHLLESAPAFAGP
jgi:uncharacterized protein (TIGR03084 family)